MRTTLAILFAAVLYSAIGQTVVDFYLDMEAGASEEILTTNLLNSCTHVAPGVGYWTFNRGHPKGGLDPFAELTNVVGFAVMTTNVGTNPVWQLRSPVSVNGTVYHDATHTRVFGYSLNQRNQAAQWNFTTPKRRVSIGFYYTMAVGWNNDFISNMLSTFMYDTSTYPSGGWEYEIMGGSIENSDAKVFVHAQSGGPLEAGTISLYQTKTYWITQLWDGENGEAKVEVYDPATWAKVGNDSTLSLSNRYCQTFAFGDVEIDSDNHFSVTNCFGNLIMDWTTATFPLLLPAAAPPTNIIVSWTPTNSATLERWTNGNRLDWQTYSNNATPPVTIPIQLLLPQELFRVRSSNSTMMIITTQ